MKISVSLLQPIALSLVPLIIYAGPLSHQGGISNKEDNQNSFNLIRRQHPAAGVGVELEDRSITFVNDDVLDHGETADMDRVKGAPFLLQGHDDAQNMLKKHKSSWTLTAELSDDTGIKRLIPEFIVNGKNIKVGADNPSLKSVGKSITEFLDVWKPGPGGKAKIEGSESDGVWKITAPPDPKGAESSIWGLQVTSPIPLGKLQTSFMDEDTRDRNSPVMALSPSKLSKLYQVRKEDFTYSKRWPKIKESDIDDEFLGFFSLVVSYAKAVGSPYNYDLGPKQTLPIMPRTDFKTMYKAFVEPKIKAQLDDGDCGLADIVDSIAGEDVSDNKFKWGNAEPASPTEGSRHSKRAKSELHKGVMWSTRAQDIKAQELEVGTWLDELQDGKEVLEAMDELVFDGQIGGLGTAMESIGGSSKGYPIFEFRDIPGVKGDKLESYFEKIDKYLAGLAPSQEKSSKKTKTSRAAPVEQVKDDGLSQKDNGKNKKECKCRGQRRKNKCQISDKCPPLQVKIRGECRPCPKGQKPNDKGDKCVKAEDDTGCSKGQTKNAITGKCEIECPDGEVLNAKGDKCSKDCPKGEKINANPGKCQIACPRGQMLNTAGDKCGKDCPSGQKKNKVGDQCEMQCAKGQVLSAAGDECGKECPKGQKKNGAGDRCEVETDDKECPKGEKKVGNRCESEDDGKECPKGQTKVGNKCKDKPNDDDKEKEKEKEEKEKKEKEENEKKEKQEKMKSRNGLCLTFVALTVDTEDFNIDDLESASENWPQDVPYIEGELTESNLQPPGPVVIPVATGAGAGIGNLITPFVRLLGKGAKSGGGKGAKPPKYAPKGSDKSKKTIDRFVNDKAYKDCLKMIPGTLSGGHTKLVIGDEVPPGGFKADEADPPLQVKLCNAEDCGNNYHTGEGKAELQTFPDALFRYDRIEVGKCFKLEKLDNKVSAYDVKGGCCVFYDGNDCKAEEALFSAANRGDGDLHKKSNNAVGSLMCNHGLCEGIPGSGQ